MKTPNLKTMALTVAAAAVAIGFIIKSGKDHVKGGGKPEDTIAGKLGLI